MQRELRIEISPDVAVSALLVRPPASRAFYVMAHGAGAGMRHEFFDDVVARLAAKEIATLRYQFPYMERGSRRPDTRAVLISTVRAAVACAREHAGDLPIVAGGKSMGGRMTSLAASEALEGVRGLVFLGFPLHPAGQPGEERAEHLARVSLPMLFLQGTRDTLAELPRIREVCARLGERARLHVVDGGDHSFHVLRRSGRTDEEARAELTDAVAEFALSQADPMPTPF